jgi:hypothetical protein
VPSASGASETPASLAARSLSALRDSTKAIHADSGGLGASDPPPRPRPGTPGADEEP